MNKSEILRHSVNIAAGRGLEIGALCRPVVAPTDGNIRYADHQSTADLRSKYSDDKTVDLDAIVEVHYVVDSGGLRKAVGNDKFDYVIASHVIEHVPDTVGWLKDIASILEPGGVLALAIPDMRFTFDCCRELTTTANLVEAYLQGRRAPSFGQILDHVLETKWDLNQSDIDAIWAGTCDIKNLPIRNAELVATLNESVLKAHYDAVTAGTYHDVHCSVWTPESFLQMLSKLCRAGLLDLELVTFSDTTPKSSEFYCSLKKLPDGIPSESMQKLMLHSIDQLTPVRFNKPAAYEHK